MSSVKSLVVRGLNSSFVNYLIRSITGFMVGYALLLSFPQYDLFWLLLSIILVISPEEKDTWKLTFERVVSNFIGSLSGLAVVFLDFRLEVKILLAILMATLLCRAFNLMRVVRSAIVAILIILIEHTGDFMSPFERFFSVLGGCLIGLVVTLVVTFILQKVKGFFQ